MSVLFTRLSGHPDRHIELKLGNPDCRVFRLAAAYGCRVACRDFTQDHRDISCVSSCLCLVLLEAVQEQE